MKFRVKHVEDKGYFAQVKRSFFGNWWRISFVNNNFYLYEEDSTNYPLKTEEGAIERCTEYKDHVNKKLGVTYTKVVI